MEKGINPMFEYLTTQFDIQEVDLKTYSPLTLAYIGDGIYELIVRTILVKRKNCPTHKLHNQASQLVKAATQSAIIHELLPDLTPEELAIYKRGRNAKSVTMAKNASMGDYRRATGFEALMGYLYLNNETDRVIDLIKIGLKRIEVQI